MTGTVYCDDLKPCPLCGRKVELVYDNQDGYEIECVCGINFIADDEYDKNLTIARWNSRTDTQQ